MKKKLIVIALMGTMLAGMLRPAGAMFDKTRFAADLGMAFFAFHHFVYAPYKAGAFASGAPHRTKALVKGGIALLFTINRLKAAHKIADNSKSPLLQHLIAPIDALSARFHDVGQRLKGGQYNPSDIDSLNGSVNTVGSGSAAAGIPVKDVPLPIPGT